MNDAIQSWMQAAVASAAVTGCGVRAAGAVHALSRRPEVSEAQITAAMKQLSEAIYFLQQNHIFTDRLRWTFERGELCCACGRAGAMALLVANKGAAADVDIEELLKSCPV